VNSASLHFAHKFFQKKKKKKRKPIVQVEGFKKASFFKKILPDASIGIESIMLKHNVILEMKGWRFF